MGFMVYEVTAVRWADFERLLTPGPAVRRPRELSNILPRVISANRCSTALIQDAPVGVKPR